MGCNSATIVVAPPATVGIAGCVAASMSRAVAGIEAVGKGDDIRTLTWEVPISAHEGDGGNNSAKHIEQATQRRTIGRDGSTTATEDRSGDINPAASAAVTIARVESLSSDDTATTTGSTNDGRAFAAAGAPGAAKMTRPAADGIPLGGLETGVGGPNGSTRLEGSA
jgi:hypothetical protein